MKKIKLFISLLALSSCNQYLGTVEPDYTPSNVITEILTNNQNNTIMTNVEFGNIIFPKFNNPYLSINNLDIVKVFKTDKNSVVNFFNDKIILSKNKNIFIIDHMNTNNNFEYKLNLNKDEKVLHFFEYKDEIYIFTNRSHLFVIDGQNVLDIVDYEVFTNKIPIVLDEILIIFGVFGDIYEVSLADFSMSKNGNFNSKPGMSLKSNIYEDQENIYYLFNTGTLITFSKNNYEHFDNYILEDLNILSSLGVFNDLIDSPFSYNDFLYFLDRSGKIAVYKPISSNILWELDVNETILSYLFSNDGYLILMTSNKILILSNNGNIVNSYTHNKESPISIFNIQGNIYLISKEGISKLNINDKSEDIFFKSKFTSGLEIYYQDLNIYLKDNKSLFKLSE